MFVTTQHFWCDQKDPCVAPRPMGFASFLAGVLLILPCWYSLCWSLFHYPYLVLPKLNKYCLITTCQNQPSLSAKSQAVLQKQFLVCNPLCSFDVTVLNFHGLLLICFYCDWSKRWEPQEHYALSCGATNSIYILGRWKALIEQEHSTLHNVAFSSRTYLGIPLPEKNFEAVKIGYLRQCGSRALAGVILLL